jgi:hypothetical protein
MPTFDFTSPDGKSYSVQGPDGATPEQAFQMLQQHIGGDAPQAGMGEDAAKSVAAGLGTATIGALGGVGDIRSLASSAIDAAGNKLGFDPSTVKNAASAASYLLPGGRMVANAPTSADVMSTVTDPIVSPDYKPQYATGSLAKKVAEFGPGMLLGGPESAWARFLTNVAAPAVGSEIGEQLAGPYGGVAGALVGGVGASAAAQKFKAMAAARQGVGALPSGEKLVATGSKQFDQARDMNIVLEPGFAQKTAANMREAVKDFDPEAQKAVFNAIDRVESMGKPKSASLTPAERLQAEMNWEKPPAAPPALPIEMNNIELARKQLSALRLSSDPPTRAAAKAAQNALTESQMALSPAEVLAGNAADYTKTLREAVGNYGAGKRAQTVEGKMNLAELNLNSPVGGLDMASSGQALQRTMKQLARPVNNTNVPVARKLGFNPAEVAAITQAANGNKLTHMGDVANQVIPHWAGGGAVGSILRAMGGLSVKRQVSAVDSLVRSRSPLAAQVSAQLPPQIINQLPAKTQRLLQSLLIADQSIAQQSQSVSQPNAYQSR